MSWLNYHHLFYFWTVVREGGVTAASKKLRLSQPTISGQLKALERSLDVELFLRKSGRLTLTDLGAHVYRYADEIFSLGRDLQESLAGRSSARMKRLVVGVADVVPKFIAQRLLQPAYSTSDDLRLVCYEDRQDRLLAQLSIHELDLVLTDAPVGAESTVRAFSHLLGESGVTLFARPAEAARLRRHFPRSLDGAAMLLPTESSSVRRALNAWFDERNLRPRIRGEFQDSALLKAFGREGLGAFPGPTVIADEVKREHGVEVVGEIGEVRERFFAVTVERKLKHPAAVAISQAARKDLFA